MTSFTLAVITLAASVALIIVSQIARRTADHTSKIHSARKILSVVVLALVAVYFYKRFVG